MDNPGKSSDCLTIGRTSAKRKNGACEEEKSENNKKKFQLDWLLFPEFKGCLKPIESDPYKCKCIACNTELFCGKSDLQKHARGAKHKNLIKMKQKNSTLSSLFKSSADSQVQKHETNVKEAEIKLASFFAEHNVAFQVVDHLLPLMKSIAPDSKILKDMHMKRKKCTHVIENVIAQAETEKVLEDIKELPFSLLVDESTDISSTKFLCVLVRYVATQTGLVVTKLLKLFPLDATDCSAEEIYKVVKNFLQNKNVPLKNIVGLACDGAYVMIGEKNSFYSRLRQDSPNVILLRCICHSAALIASRACEELPRSAENLIKEVSTYISGSAKRNAQIVEIQEFLGEEKKKILKPSLTRWLSMHQCVTRILENWTVLEIFFRVATLEDKLKHAESILNELNNWFTKAYLLFLKYALTFFNEFNALFQARKPLIHKLASSSVKLLRCFGQNFLSETALNNIENVNVKCPNNFLADKDIYVGPECEELLQKMGETEVLIFKKKCLKFYITAGQEIQNRLPIKNQLFKEMEFLAPEVAFNGSFRSKIKDLSNLGNIFKDFVDVNTLFIEWRTLPQFFDKEEAEKLSSLSIDKMWAEIASTKTFEDKIKFPNLGKLSKLILSLPHSNAEAERIFSIVNDVKTKKRNRLGHDALNGVAIVKSAFQDDDVNCFNFAVTEAHLKLFNTEHLYKTDD